jgi:hypothetical protein
MLINSPDFAHIFFTMLTGCSTTMTALAVLLATAA